ncbi:tetratricopeptide repeat protein [Streptomyces aureus]
MNWLITHLYGCEYKREERCALIRACAEEEDPLGGPQEARAILSRRAPLAAGERSVAAESVGAVALSEATLRQHERVLGDSHLETLAMRNDLAMAYELAGDLGRAIPLYEATLAA